MQLKELYGDSLTNNVELTDLFFLKAFPVDPAKASKAIGAVSEKAFGNFFELHRIRLATWISDQLEASKPPQEIIDALPWITKNEITFILEALDATYNTAGLDVLSQLYLHSVRIIDLNYYYMTLKEVSYKLLYDMGRAHDAKKSSLIVTPFNNPAPASKLIMP